MSHIAEQLRAGLALHRAGRAFEADAVYQRVIGQDPQCVDAWHLSGRVALDRGDTANAMARIVRAIRISPETPAFHNSLGEVFTACGQVREASLCYREALRLEPGFVPALVNLGNGLQSAGKYREASVLYGKAIEIQADCAQAYTNLGNALRALGCSQEAMGCYREALRLQPDDPAVLVNLAAGHLQEREYRDAEEFARRALRIKPSLAEGHSNLSLALLNQGRLAEAEGAAREALSSAPLAAHLHLNLSSVLLRGRRFAEAEAACRRALELGPENVEAASNLGIILQGQDRLDEAAESLQSAIARRPEYAEAWTNLGTVEELRERHEAALGCFDKAIQINPSFPKAHFCRGLALLRAGRFSEGFAEYEWRWKAQRQTARAQSGPAWDGSPAAGKTILLFAEQGLGDTIQFARFVPMVAAAGARVVVECQPALAGLLRGLDGVAQVVTTEDPLPEFDAQAALMSLPHLLGIADDLEAIRGASPWPAAASQSALLEPTGGAEVCSWDRPPGLSGARSAPSARGQAGRPVLQTPYLHAAAGDVETMRRTLGPPNGLRIGLAWAGNPKHPSDRRRSIPLAELEPLREITRVEWISLHVGDGAGWLRQPLSQTGGVSELAALTNCLDLVISVDSMPAHLAGALGRPVWLMLCRTPDWRWRLEREDSPWYPTMRLFRQQASGEWRPVVRRLEDAILRLTNRHSEPICTSEGRNAERQRAQRVAVKA